MKLSLTPTPPTYTMYTALTYIPSSPSLLVATDNATLLKFSHDGDAEEGGKEGGLEVGVTDVAWFPNAGKQVVDMFAAACTDGSLRFLKKSGLLEKKIAAHNGAVIGVAWNADGSSLCTCGEDGEVKIWSRNGNLRTSLFSAGSPVNAVCWGPTGRELLVAYDNLLTVKSAGSGSGAASKKTMQWQVMEKGCGVVTTCDWNAVNNLIVTGGEDCVYRVFDSYGLPLYVSKKSEHVVTSVRWRPNGNEFAVGSYNVVRLCDRTGWTYCRERTTGGSFMKIRWSADGTQLAGACGNGVAIFAQIINRTLEYGSITATLTDPKKISIADCTSSSMDAEELDFPRDRVVDFALGFDHLVVCTATQCFIYESPNYNTPQIFDLKNPVNLIILSAKSFAIADTVMGMQIYSYEGRVLSQPKFQGLRPESLSADCVSLSSDVIAILDQTDMKTVRVFDVLTGRPSGGGAEIKHDQEITKIALSQYGISSLDRRLVFIDSNREMFITPTAPLPGVQKKFQIQKLGTQVDTCCWNDNSDLLACIADSRLIVYYYPHALYVDKDLLPLTQQIEDGGEFGKMPQIQTFFGTSISVRRADGALMTTTVPPYPAMLYEYAAGGRFKECVQLCRFIKSKELWGTLAGMAVQHQDLDSAEIALSAVKEVDKLQYIKFIKNLPNVEIRNSEMMLYKRCSDEAESILLQASPKLVYHAVKLNVRLFKWERALEIAEKEGKYVDIVCWYRRKFLAEFGREENIKGFGKYLGEEYSDEEIGRKKEEARDGELGGGGGRK